MTKITGGKLCEATCKQFDKDYVSLMPTDLYGSHDNYDLNTSHAIAAMIRKFWKAKQKNNEDVVLWGTCTTLREFKFVDDLVSAVVCFLLKKILTFFIILELRRISQ